MATAVKYRHVIGTIPTDRLVETIPTMQRDIDSDMNMDRTKGSELRKYQSATHRVYAFTGYRISVNLYHDKFYGYFDYAFSIPLLTICKLTNIYI